MYLTCNSLVVPICEYSLVENLFEPGVTPLKLSLGSSCGVGESASVAHTVLTATNHMQKVVSL